MPGFQAEWEQCLDGEVSGAQADLTLPLVIPRHEIRQLTGVDNLFSLALRTLYVGALRPAELFNLRPQDLANLTLDPVTAAALGALALTRPELFSAQQSELEKQLAETPLARRYQECGRSLVTWWPNCWATPTCAAPKATSMSPALASKPSWPNSMNSYVAKAPCISDIFKGHVLPSEGWIRFEAVVRS